MKLAATLSVPPRRFLGFCEQVDDYLTGLDDGVEVFGFTSGDFSLIDILARLIRRMQSPAVVLSTWTAAGADMQHVHDFLESGGVASARWIVDRSFQNRQPALCDTLRAKFGDEAIRVQRVHCKFALLQDATRKITLQTSANLNRNMRIENVSVSSCPVFFDAYSQLVADIFDTQVPGAGFETDGAVSSSFRQIAKRKAKRKTIPAPWANPTGAPR